MRSPTVGIALKQHRVLTLVRLRNGAGRCFANGSVGFCRSRVYLSHLELDERDRDGRGQGGQEHGASRRR
jgi:hypothetical protein